MANLIALTAFGFILQLVGAAFAANVVGDSNQKTGGTVVGIGAVLSIIGLILMTARSISHL